MSSDLINNAQLQLIQPRSSASTPAGASTIITGKQLISKMPTLFLLIRRPGCPSCREIAYELSQRANEIKKTYGVQIVAIMKENIADDIEGFREYFSTESSTDGANAVGDIYVDKNMDLFKTLTDGKLVEHNVFTALLKPSVWRNVKRSLGKVKSGSLAGNASIYGGYLLVDKDATIKYKYNEELGVLPSLDELVGAMQSLSSSSIKLETGPKGNVQRMACDEMKCEIVVSH